MQERNSRRYEYTYRLIKQRQALRQCRRHQARGDRFMATAWARQAHNWTPLSKAEQFKLLMEMGD